MQEPDKLDKLESAASSEGSGLGLRVDGESVLQHSFSVRSIEQKAEVNAVQVSQPVAEDHGQSIADMLKALAVELKSGFETFNANQAEIRGLCEDLGKKIDDLAGRTAASEEEVGELRGPEGLEDGDLKGFMARLIKQEVNVEISEEDIVKDIQRVHRVPAKMPFNRDRPRKILVYFKTF
ncbi:hypothetical protein NDU88_002687 [Pleurodeles waltl]|uniref:Uncharacterized protein n=1 Tax=Pleurodeles waltl TaxID=8319 RepID=A0AAV7MQE2_PLEWA|nr:hypothetical protein NDU88_002687 [Pleurodeles waltl]